MTRQGAISRSTALEVSTLTITRSTRFQIQCDKMTNFGDLQTNLFFENLWTINNLLVDISLHLVPIQQFFFIFLLNGACLVEKQQMRILLFLVWLDRGSTALKANTVTNCFSNKWAKMILKQQITVQRKRKVKQQNKYNLIFCPSLECLNKECYCSHIEMESHTCLT
jgi:hypothetical protein